MTIKEAIEILPYIGKPEHIYSLQECEAIQISIESLVKQIPKKPLDLQETIDAAYVKYSCPCCSKRKCKVKGEEEYCVNCGQRIDWGGTET